MIIYSNTNLAFRQDVESNYIADIIEANFIEKIGHRESPAEKTAWRNSMQYMERVLRNSKIKDVKQIYKVLMSRGRYGCYVYCRDENLKKYLISRLSGS